MPDLCFFLFAFAPTNSRGSMLSTRSAKGARTMYLTSETLHEDVAFAISEAMSVK